MLGEIDFLGTYVRPYYLNEEGRSLPFPIPAFLILGLFMVLMPILLMNLLIGLAVGDIESVRRNAQLKRLAMQVIRCKGKKFFTSSLHIVVSGGTSHGIRKETSQHAPGEGGQMRID